MKNSGNWAHHLLFCDNVVTKNVTVEAGHDGFDASVCRNVLIEDCSFYTGDDCIAGFGNTNVFVNRCVLNSSCSAFRFGGTNVYIKNCKAYAPGKYSFRGGLSKQEKIAGVMANAENSRNNMLCFFTYYADYSVPIPEIPRNIVIENCEIYEADKLMHYNFSGNEAWQRYRPLESIRFENVKAFNIRMPSVIYGSKEVPIIVELENTDISVHPDSKNIAVIHAANFKKILLENVKIENPKGECLIKCWTDCGDIEIKNLESSFSKENYIKYSDSEFECRPI